MRPSDGGGTFGSGVASAAAGGSLGRLDALYRRMQRMCLTIQGELDVDLYLQVCVYGTVLADTMHVG